MEKQYYTPDIEDLCVGYVCEINISPNSDPAWYDYRISNPYEVGEVFEFINRNRIRVPYLTKEQIESFGWEEFSFIEEWQCMGFTKGDYTINYFPKIKNLDVDHLINGIIFNGKCRCINDFRKILKLLGIK